MMWHSRFIRVAALSCILGLGIACDRKDVRPPAAVAPRSQSPNLLLITFDTTRADHLAPYGAKFAFNPTLNRLAARSVKFTRAFAPAPLTSPSHCTLFTGLYPFYHGVRTNSHFVLSPDAVTMAEVLGGAGYQTAAMVSCFMLDGRFGLRQGFETYDDEMRPASEFPVFEVPERTAETVTERALDWLKKASTDRPWFLWVHYFDAHFPYAPPPSFTRYQGDAYDMEIAYADTQMGRLLAAVEERDSAQSQQSVVVFTADHGEALEERGEPTHAYYVYDNTLHVPLIVRLPGDAHAGAASSAIVSLADVFPTVLDVLGMPARPANSMHGRSLRPAWESETVPPELVDRPIPFECYEPYYKFGWAAARGVRVGEIKYIELPDRELFDLSASTRELPADNIYSTRPDLAGQMQTILRELFESNLAIPSLVTAPHVPDEDVRQRLQALGYAATAPAKPDEAQDRDLKKMLPTYRRILEALALAGRGESSSAINILIELVPDDPGNVDCLWVLAKLTVATPSMTEVGLPVLLKALEQGKVPPEFVAGVWQDIGRIYLNKNDNATALSYFEKVAEAAPADASGQHWKALALLRLNRPQDALIATKRGADISGEKNFDAQALLGFMGLAAGDLAVAKAAWSRCLGDGSSDAVWALAMSCPHDAELARLITPALLDALTRGDLPPAQRAALSIISANMEISLGDHARAAELLTSARALLPPKDITLLLTLAREYGAVGDRARALGLVREAYESAPQRTDVVMALAAAHEEADEIDDAVKLLAGLHELRPEDPDIANNYAWVLTRQGKELDLAFKLATDALNRRPSNPAVEDTMGAILLARHEPAAAVGHFGRATRIAPDNAAYHYRHACALRDSGKSTEAQTAFRKAVDLAPQPRPSWFAEAERGAGGN